MTEVKRTRPLPRTSSEPPSPVERFQKRWREVPAPEPPAGPTPEQNRRYDESMARQRQIERERWAFTARRRNYEDELDGLFNLSGDPRVDFMRLHERPRGTEARVAVVLRYAFACHLDRVRGEYGYTQRAVRELPGPAELLAGARSALAEAEPELARVVEATCFRCPAASQRVLASELGVHPSQVSRRKWRGLAWMRTWLHEQLSQPQEAAG